MRTRTKVIVSTGAALAIAGAAATVTMATGGQGTVEHEGVGEDEGFEVGEGSEDQQLQGTDLDRAAAAALEHTGGGTVVESEVGDGGAAFEVEVQLPDGSIVEVQLDQNFRVSASSGDDET